MTHGHIQRQKIMESRKVRTGQACQRPEDQQAHQPCKRDEHSIIVTQNRTWIEMPPAVSYFLQLLRCRRSAATAGTDAAMRQQFRYFGLIKIIFHKFDFLEKMMSVCPTVLVLSFPHRKDN